MYSESLFNVAFEGEVQPYFSFCKQSDCLLNLVINQAMTACLATNAWFGNRVNK
jgi:hypothetical protein